ncbi:MAG TPA: DivIVA domain-containing protein [Lacisediminihabitans sp.]|uniref:DivIVA domain-containing protein n=1 Tax=Lacisediminihabitans sp. TaxID=2787631 RepID=UPI002ED7C1AE
MSTTFPRTRNSRRGYSVEQVEDFLEDARRAYTAEPSEPTVVTAASIRQMAFDMQKGGYSAVHVDAALERLEDAFASRERERAIQQRGDEAWYTEARGIAQEVLDRLARPEGHRFDRVSFLSNGYRRKDVDALGNRLVRYFQDGKPMSVEEVRTAAFRPQKGGYREAQVDLLLDAVVNVMLAVR